jgi:hypothetical protein
LIACSERIKRGIAQRESSKSSGRCAESWHKKTEQPCGCPAILSHLRLSGRKFFFRPLRMNRYQAFSPAMQLRDVTHRRIAHFFYTYVRAGSQEKIPRRCHLIFCGWQFHLGRRLAFSGRKSLCLTLTGTGAATSSSAGAPTTPFPAYFSKGAAQPAFMRSPRNPRGLF